MINLGHCRRDRGRDADYGPQPGPGNKQGYLVLEVYVQYNVLDVIDHCLCTYMIKL